MVESGLVREHSIGFQTISAESSKAERANLITEVKLYEGSSLTAWGANENTPLVELKGKGYNKSIRDRINAFERFIRNADVTEDTVDLCLIQIKQLTSLLDKGNDLDDKLVKLMNKHFR